MFQSKYSSLNEALYIYVCRKGEIERGSITCLFQYDNTRLRNMYYLFSQVKTQEQRADRLWHLLLVLLCTIMYTRRSRSCSSGKPELFGLTTGGTTFLTGPLLRISTVVVVIASTFAIRTAYPGPVAILITCALYADDAPRWTPCGNRLY